MRFTLAPASSLAAWLLLPLAVAACSASSAPGEPGGGDTAGTGGTKASGKAGTAGSSGDAGAGLGDAGEGAGSSDGDTNAKGGTSAKGGTGGTGGAGGGGGTDPGTAGMDGGTAGTDGGTAGNDGGAGAGGVVIEPPPQVSQVYAHSPTQLYKMDPLTKEVSLVGSFNCITGTEMWDIAIDSTGYMVGSGPNKLTSINPNDGTCKTLANGLFPNSLTFIPKGTLDPAVEALVGFRESEYVRIDPVKGTITPIGNLNPNPSGKEWESSGDVVSIIGDKTYLTVHPPATSWSGPDTIVEVDPLTGKVVKVIGDTGHGKLWGLAFWDSIAYGFSSDGSLVQIDLTTGAGKSVPITDKPSGLSFYGAGVTTAARISPPK